ncbi:DUF5988 family protein [Streptomyces boncukensis]|uniref:Uncharacterized protein n=1 Tax=Streptomyces boncukensis TaxID=2711219 RepID=A0A6G4X2U4_9ACTN|nr:DUF5988 family protein [Streptomyces boncukensis]NGO71859.1 hypothetical protein [Streptomyces boncukensis]
MEMNNPGPNALLVGGPDWSNDEPWRVRHVKPEQITIKVNVGNRYEHFQRTGQEVVREQRQLNVFEWSHSTFVAE